MSLHAYLLKLCFVTTPSQYLRALDLLGGARQGCLRVINPNILRNHQFKHTVQTTQAGPALHFHYGVYAQRGSPRLTMP